jgi:hypothetical protein
VHRVAPFAAIAIPLLAFNTAAWGQSSLSLSAESEHRFRGVSLSSGKPDLRLGVDGDLAGGWFVGGSITGAEIDAGARRAELLAYAGRARPAGPAMSWEIGVTAAHFESEPSYDYAEAFAGWMAERWSLRAFLSPSYFGSGRRTLYSEANGVVPLGGSWRLFGHLGALTLIGGHAEGTAARQQLDGRLGGGTTVGMPIGDADLQLAWVGSGRGHLYPMPNTARRQAWVLSTTLTF